MLTVTRTEATPSVAPAFALGPANDREADIVTSISPRTRRSLGTSLLGACPSNRIFLDEEQAS